MTKRLLQLVAVALFGISLTPLPGGLFFAGAGGALLICTTPAFARFVRGCRRRFDRFNRLVEAVEKRAPRHMADVLHATRPSATDEEVANPHAVRADPNA